MVNALDNLEARRYVDMWIGGWVGVRGKKGGGGGEKKGGREGHDQFFKSQGVVVNALDNLEARRYVDRYSRDQIQGITQMHSPL